MNTIYCSNMPIGLVGTGRFLAVALALATQLLFGAEETSYSEIKALLQVPLAPSILVRSCELETTQEMRRLAETGESIIENLLKIVVEGPSEGLKHRAICTLYLVDVRARAKDYLAPNRAHAALLACMMKVPSQCDFISSLLSRDCLELDLPFVFLRLELRNPNEWQLVKLLQLYKIKNPPVHQLLPVSMPNHFLPLKGSYRRTLLEFFNTQNSILVERGTRIKD